MQVKFDITPYSNLHLLVTHTRWGKLSFLVKESYVKIHEKYQPPPPLLKKHPPLKVKILGVEWVETMETRLQEIDLC